jgi:predicted ArsR family transcriptional regulator
MAVDLLDQIVEMDGPDKIDQLFARQMDALHQEYSDRMDDLSLPEKVEALSSIRDREGYMAEADTDSVEAFILIEHLCPIYRNCPAFSSSLPL